MGKFMNARSEPAQTEIEASIDAMRRAGVSEVLICHADAIIDACDFDVDELHSDVAGAVVICLGDGCSITVSE